MRRAMLAAVGLAYLVTLGGCMTTNPKTTVLNLDSTDPKWTSKRCVAARKEVFEFNDHGALRTVVGLGGNVAAPFAGTAASLAIGKSQDKKRQALNAKVESACVSRRRSKTPAT